MKHIQITFDIEEITEQGNLKPNKELKEIFKKEMKQLFFPAVLEKLNITISKSNIKEEK